jgi:DNA polymerase
MRVVLDVESYHDSEVTLKRMPMAAYIDAAEPLGVGLQVDDRPPVYLPPDKLHLLHRLPWSEITLVAHNAAFDVTYITRHLGVPHPSFVVDTMALARAQGHLEVSLSALSTHFLPENERKMAMPPLSGRRWDDLSAEEREAVSTYCLRDVSATRAIYERLVKGLPLREIRSMDQVIRMHTQPTLVVNPAPLYDHLDVLSARREALLQSVGVPLTSLRSNPKFAEALRSLGVEPPMKVNKKGEAALALAKSDQGLQALLQHPDERVRVLVEARLGTKSSIEETRVQRFLMSADRPLPILLQSSGALTSHRLSGGDRLNIQNLPRSGALRDCLTAPAGHRVVAVDSAQIEARVLAWLAEEEAVVDAFRNRRDVYSEQASRIYGRVIDPKANPNDKVPRTVGKIAVLSLGYGAGALRLAESFLAGPMGAPPIVFTVDAAREMGANPHDHPAGAAAAAPPATILPLDQWLVHCAVSAHIVRLYRQSNAAIEGLWADADSALRAIHAGAEYRLGKGGCVVTTKEGLLCPGDMRIRYKSLRPSRRGWEYVGRKEGRIQAVPLYGAKVIENVCQYIAGAVIRWQMLEVEKQLGVRVAFQVHDEIVAVVPEDRADEVVKNMTAIMSVAPSWTPDLPLAAAGGHAANYGSVDK